MNKLLNAQSRKSRWGILLITLGFAVGAHLLFHRYMGGTSSAFFALPIMAASWYFGWAGILLMIIISASTIISTELISKGLIWENYPWSLHMIGIAASLAIGVITILMRRLIDERNRELQEQKKAEKESLLQTKFLVLLNDILHAALGTEDLNSLLAVLASRTGELFSADDCFITIWDENTKVAVPAVAYGTMRQTYKDVVPRPGERTLTSSALEVGGPLIVEDTANTPYVDNDVAIPFPKLKSALGLPLFAGERRLGGLIVGYHQKHIFSKDEIAKGELAARQISLAMMKAMLLEETRKNLSELAGLHAIAQTFTLQDDPYRTFGLLTEIVTGLLNTEICLVALYDPIANEMRGQPYAAGIADEQVEEFRHPAAPGWDIWHFNRNAVFQANTVQEMPAEIVQPAAALGLRNILVAPLRNAEQMLLGILLVGNRQGSYTQDDLRLLEILANQASVVVENTRLLAAERRRTKEINVLNKIAVAASAARNEDELIEEATRLIGEQLFPDNFGVMLLDQKKRELFLHSSYRMGVREAMIRIPVGTGITGWVAATGRMRRVENAQNEADYVDADERVHSELCAPLKIGDQVIGVLNAESIKTGAFTIEDENLLEIIAGQLAGAIQRLRIADAENHQTTLLTRANALIRVLAQVGSRAASAPDPEGVMRTLGNELGRIGMTCTVALPRDKKTLNIAYTSIRRQVVDLYERFNRHPLGELPIPVDEVLPVDDPELAPSLLENPREIIYRIIGDRSLHLVEKTMCKIGMKEDIPVCQLPLTSDGKLQGVLWMWGEGIKESDLPTLSIFGNQVAIALQNSRLLNEVQRLAILDHGTGIFNRRHFFDRAEQEFSKARRYRQPLTAIIVDVDNFKTFNDKHGHIVGDQVLYAVAQTLKSNLREGDILGRYGGEEFSIMLPFTNLGAARVVAERLCECVAEAKIQSGIQQLAVTVSIGMAEYAPGMKTLLSLVEQADQAMYNAKEEGGNRVHAR